MGRLTGARALMEAVSWDGLKTNAGNATDVPSRLFRLFEAADVTEAESAYWQLDNHIIVQGRMYWSAVASIPTLGAALLSQNLSPPALHGVIDLLTEIALGHGHEREKEPDEITHEARVELSRMLYGFYALAGNSDDRVRRCVIDILEVLEPEEPRWTRLDDVYRRGG